MKFNFALSARFDVFLSFDDLGFDFNNRLLWDLRRVLDHTFRGVVIDEEISLNCGGLLSQDHETHLSFRSRVLDSGSDDHNLVDKFHIDIFDIGKFFSESNLWIALRPVELKISELMG